MVARREKPTAAFLLHGIRWRSDRPVINVTRSISLNCAEGHPATNLYARVCSTLGFDDGEPLGYEVCAVFSDWALALDSGIHFAPVDRLCNILVLLTGTPIVCARSVFSDRAFGAWKGGDTLYRPVWESPLDTAKWGDITTDLVAPLRRAWRITARNLQGRVATALAFYYHAWRSFTSEQVCLNLAVALETLFSPHAAGETTHQLAFNAAQFLGGSSSAKAETYKRVKDFYNVRSAVVHGGQPKDAVLNSAANDGFRLLSQILTNVVTQRGVAKLFDDEESRRSMLTAFLFGR